MMRVEGVFLGLSLFLGLSAHFSYSASAQTFPLQPITNYSHKEYRAGSQTWEILQDPQGVLHFANNDGLLSYDGHEWQLRQVPNFTIIRSLCLDQNRIYVGAEGEFGYYQPDARGVLKYHSLIDKLPGSVAQRLGDVWDIIAWEQQIFFRSSDLLIVFHQDKLTVFPLAGTSHFMALWPEIGIVIQVGFTDFYRYKAGELELWQRWDQLTGPTTGFFYAEDAPTYLVTLKQGLFEVVNQELRPWQHPWNHFLQENWINSAAILQDGRMAFATHYGGVALLDKNGQGEVFNKDSGLQKNNVLSVHQDLSGDLWLGTDRGIDYLEISSPFHSLQPDPKQEAVGYAVASWRDRLFLGTSNGIYAQSPPDAKFGLIPNTSGQVWGLGVHRDLLLAGHSEGTLIWQNGQFIPIHADYGTWTFRPLNDTILVVGRYEGISFLKYEDQTWKPYGHLEGYEVSSRLIEVDQENATIWVAHPYKGIYRIRLKECCFPSPSYSVDYYGEDSGLPSKLLNHIFRINNKLLVAAEHGIYEFDHASNRFEPYPPLSSRLEDLGRVKWLKEDVQGNIWFLAEEELGMLHVNDQGLERTWSRDLFTGVGEKLVNGFEMIEPMAGHGVIFGSEDGFLQFWPDHKIASDQGFQTILKEVRLTDRRDSILYQGWLGSRPPAKPTLDYRQSTVAFQYTGTSYRSTSQVEFQYRLVGLNSKWSNWSDKSEKEFTSLAPGEYRFEVRARKGLESVAAAKTFAFRIAPPWYATKFAYSMYGMVGLVSLGLILGMQRTRFEQEKAQLEENQRKREQQHQEEVRESEEKISQLKNEKLQAEVQHKNQELAMATMHLVQKGEILSTLQNELKRIIGQHREAPQLNRSLRDLVKMVQQDQRLDEEWERFAYHFDQVHSDFLKRLKTKFPNLSPNDFRLCSYLRMNLTSKEIAPLMNISVRGVEASRYRLRKKLELDSNTNLQEFILKL